jgi:hypothetical protein
MVQYVWLHNLLWCKFWFCIICYGAVCETAEFLTVLSVWLQNFCATDSTREYPLLTDSQHRTGSTPYRLTAQDVINSLPTDPPDGIHSLTTDTNRRYSLPNDWQHLTVSTPNRLRAPDGIHSLNTDSTRRYRLYRLTEPDGIQSERLTGPDGINSLMTDSPRRYPLPKDWQHQTLSTPYRLILRTVSTP